uniref:Uncharacterized protein n=1 Tax=Labrus bergylta TaxID=56723 RepID=A0A3Q3FF79_9LABR
MAMIPILCPDGLCCDSASRCCCLPEEDLGSQECWVPYTWVGQARNKEKIRKRHINSKLYHLLIK